MKVARPANHWISGSEMPNEFTSLPLCKLPNQTQNTPCLPQTNNLRPALGIRWYRLYIDPVTRIPGLAAWGEISDQKNNFDYFNPSIISLGKDDYTIASFSRSGFNGDPSGNIGAYAAVLPPETAPGTTTDIFPLQIGQRGDYTPVNQQRWGDYCTICRDPDPQHPRRVWTTNQYVIGAGPATWGAIIASLELDPPPAAS
jgi:hypothetical protein